MRIAYKTETQTEALVKHFKNTPDRDSNLLKYPFSLPAA